MQIQWPLLATNGTNPNEFFHESLPQAAIMNQLRLFVKTILAIFRKLGQAVARNRYR